MVFSFESGKTAVSILSCGSLQLPMLLADPILWNSSVADVTRRNKPHQT